MIAITRRTSKICQTRKEHVLRKQSQQLHLFLKICSGFFTSHPSQIVRVVALSKVRTLSISLSLRQTRNKLHWKLASKICLDQATHEIYIDGLSHALRTFRHYVSGNATQRRKKFKLSKVTVVMSRCTFIQILNVHRCIIFFKRCCFPWPIDQSIIVCEPRL